MITNPEKTTALVSLTASLPFAESEARSAIAPILRRRAEEGCLHFLCPMRQGFELLMAEEVIALRGEFPVTLTALLPHERIAEDWEEEVRDRFFSAVAAADREILYTARPFLGAEEECLRLGTRLSHSVIAVAEGELPLWLCGDVTVLSPKDLERKMA